MKNNTTNTLAITVHGGKMEGVESIGTVCTCNAFCLERMKNKDSVCCHCYAARISAYRKSLREALERNYAILTTRIIPTDDLPTIRNRQIFRFESFGDIANATQLINYVNIAKKNKSTNFALWTKNIWLLDDVFNKQSVKKPANLRIIVSSPVLNVPITLPDKYDAIVDKVFTVYDKAHATSVTINCGGRKCADCQKCYRKNKITQINELLK